MKVHLKGRPRPFQLVKVTCHDNLMIEMVNCSPDSPNGLTMSELYNYRENKHAPFLYRFISGASLKVGDDAHEFFVYGTLADGSDVLAAVEELKMLDALRLAKKHFHDMKKVCYNPLMEKMSLRVTQF